MDFKESDLYPPVYEYFTSLGYDVQAEVNSCDLVAKRDGETIIAELKRNFCLKLVYQAVERQKITDTVYVVIPRPKKGAKSSEWRNMLNLMKRLDIGIITVALDSELKTIDVVATPKSSQKPKSDVKRASLNKEANARNIRSNTGGVTKTKILTAYREKSIYILCVLEKLETASPAQLNKLMGEEKTGAFLGKNYYKWFKKISRGIYGISEKGTEILNGEEYSEAVEFYRKKASEIIM